MNDMERAKLQDEISAAFRDGTILTAKEEKLQEYLMSLCSEHVPNDMVRHRETIRALTINHIQMQRHIDNLDRKSSRLQKWVIALAVASLIGTAAQTYKILLPEQPKPPIASETILKPTAIEQQTPKNIPTKANAKNPDKANKVSTTSSQPPK